MQSFVDSSAACERWLGERLVLVRADLKSKHEKMATKPFPFLRGSFFRWVEVWPGLCPELAHAPRVLGIGDLHVENFGTWRDGEGRLAWGANDFDEAATMPYTNDLVRLCTSALLAVEESSSKISTRSACAALLEGYRDSLTSGGSPIVLGKRHEWLRDLVENRLEEEGKFWKDLVDLDVVRTPPFIRRLLARAMPERKIGFHVLHRTSGLGSLGRQRFTAVAEWHGGPVAREAKALTESAWHWRQGSGEGRSRRAARVQYDSLVQHAVRALDPSVQVQGDWVVRRLAPDCRKIEIKKLPRNTDLLKLLTMMGWETPNMHLARERQRGAVLRDLKRRKGKWLYEATERMAEVRLQDWKEWRKAR